MDMSSHDCASTIEIAGRAIGPGQPCFIIAEAGVNHNGRLETALDLVDVAASTGADAIKFQTFKAEKIATAQASKAEYQARTTSSNETQLEMLKQLELSFDDFRIVKARCDLKGLIFLSTPFDMESADFLHNLGVPAFKIPSGEVVNHPFLEYIARKSRPIIMSTGMCHLGEVDQAVQVVYNTGLKELALLHCVSNYPADPADVNLRAMNTMAAAFQVPVGFSDHTLGTEVALAAVALGASLIEKHFTLDKDQAGPDHQSSLEPVELEKLVRGIRTIEAALGHGRKEPAGSEAAISAVARRSLVASKNIGAGTVLTRDLIAIKRPGNGIPPSMLPYIVGRKARTNIPAESLLTLEMLD